MNKRLDKRFLASFFFSFIMSIAMKREKKIIAVKIFALHNDLGLKKLIEADWKKKR